VLSASNTTHRGRESAGKLSEDNFVTETSSEWRSRFIKPQS
jgi:hypothetical protein